MSLAKLLVKNPQKKPKPPPKKTKSRAKVEEDLDTDSMVDAIMEKLTVDMGAELAGWAGRSSADMKHEIEKEMAHRRSTDVEEEMEALKKAQEELVFENKRTQMSIFPNYEQVVHSLKKSYKM